jgi:hypothetical protein
MPSPGPSMFCQAGFEPATDGLEDRSSTLELLAGLRPNHQMPVIHLRTRRDGELIPRTADCATCPRGGHGRTRTANLGNLVPRPADPACVDVSEFVARHSVVIARCPASTLGYPGLRAPLPTTVYGRGAEILTVSGPRGRRGSPCRGEGSNLHCGPESTNEKFEFDVALRPRY